MEFAEISHDTHFEVFMRRVPQEDKALVYERFQKKAESICNLLQSEAYGNLMLRLGREAGAKMSVQFTYMKRNLSTNILVFMGAKNGKIAATAHYLCDHCCEQFIIAAQSQGIAVLRMEAEDGGKISLSSGT